MSVPQIRSHSEDLVLQALGRIEAIESLKTLKARYFQAVDEKDWPTIAELFTDDAHVDFSGEVEYHIGHHGVGPQDSDPAAWLVTGGQDTAEVIRAAVGQIISVHHGHDPQIRLIPGGLAVGRWSLYDRLEYPDEVMHGYGHYDEQYRLVDGVWRISELILRRTKVVWETVASGTAG